MQNLVVLIANPCTKFEDGGFNRVIICRLGHAMVNLPTKFEVSTFTHYGDMKNVKCTKWGDFGCLGVTQGHSQCHHSVERV